MLNNQKESSLRILLYRLYHKDKGKLLAIYGKNTLNKLWGEKPVPLVAIFFLAKIIPKSKRVNGLYIKDDFQIIPGVEITNLKLSHIVVNQVLGEWSLDIDTINYLEKDIKRIRPKKILEFGSGISTVCLAQFLTEIHGIEPNIRVYSIEQDQRFAKESEYLIRDHGYDKYVRILHAPLSKEVVEEVECYSYDLKTIGGLLDGEEFDYCLIDGPSVSDFDGRFATLPLVRKHLSKKARFILDDALRSNELFIAKKWKRLPYIEIQGMVLTRKGLLTGFVRN